MRLLSSWDAITQGGESPFISFQLAIIYSSFNVSNEGSCMCEYGYTLMGIQCTYSNLLHHLQHSPLNDHHIDMPH